MSEKDRIKYLLTVVHDMRIYLAIGDLGSYKTGIKLATDTLKDFNYDN